MFAIVFFIVILLACFLNLKFVLKQKFKKIEIKKVQNFVQKIEQFWGQFWAKNWFQHLSETGPILGLVLGLVFMCFWIRGAAPSTSKSLQVPPSASKCVTLSGEVPRARLVRAVQINMYMAMQKGNGSNTPWPKGRRSFKEMRVNGKTVASVKGKLGNLGDQGPFKGTRGIFGTTNWYSTS